MKKLEFWYIFNHNNVYNFMQYMQLSLNCSSYFVSRKCQTGYWQF